MPDAHIPSDLSQKISAETHSWIGTPYRHQASLKGVGCDCLGLLRGVWRAVLGSEPEAPPPYGPGWAEATTGEDPLVAAARRHLLPVIGPLPDYRPQAGDILLFAFRAHLPAKHCAIATGPDAMVHAHDGAVVSEVAITGWWRRHLVHAFRFPEIGSFSETRPWPR